MARPPEQRTAQRTLIGLFGRGSGVWLDETRGLCVWRGRESGEWGLGVTELSQHLDALKIPYTVAVEMQTVRGQQRAGFTLQVDRKDFGTITKWVPSFQKLIDAAETEWTGRGPSS